MSSLLPAWSAPITVPCSWAYRAVIAARNKKYDDSKNCVTLDLPVISVGNITTGGAGKSPHVRWIVEHLRAMNHRPVIAMRGYKAPSGEAGDEELEYRDVLPDTPVVANPDRATALRHFLPQHSEIDCVVLDDGFQHRRVARNLDIVLIDATRDTMRDRLLPAGNLREPLENLRRADAVIVTRADSVDERLAASIEKHHGRPPLAWTKHEWIALRVVDAAGECDEPIERLNGKRVAALLGVGNPKSIIAQLEQHGANVAVNVPAADHERYGRAKIAHLRGLADGLDAVVMTAKDWVKARRLIDLQNWPGPIVVPRLEISFVKGQAAFEQLLQSAFEENART